MYSRIRNLREDKDLKQVQMADFLCVSQTTYSRYESGVLDIPTEVLKQLALFHCVSVDYLIEMTDVKKPYPKINKK